MKHLYVVKGSETHNASLKIGAFGVLTSLTTYLIFQTQAIGKVTSPMRLQSDLDPFIEIKPKAVSKWVELLEHGLKPPCRI